MTVEHLLTHATGIPDLIFSPEGETGPNALENWASSLNEVGLHAPPGALLQLLQPQLQPGRARGRARQRDGVPHRTWTSHVFARAGMNRTTFDPAEVVAGGNCEHRSS